VKEAQEDLLYTWLKGKGRMPQEWKEGVEEIPHKYSKEVGARRG